MTVFNCLANIELTKEAPLSRFVIISFLSSDNKENFIAICNLVTSFHTSKQKLKEYRQNLYRTLLPRKKKVTTQGGNASNENTIQTPNGVDSDNRSFGPGYIKISDGLRNLGNKFGNCSTEELLDLAVLLDINGRGTIVLSDFILFCSVVDESLAQNPTNGRRAFSELYTDLREALSNSIVDCTLEHSFELNLMKYKLRTLAHYCREGEAVKPKQGIGFQPLTLFSQFLLNGPLAAPCKTSFQKLTAGFLDDLAYQTGPSLPSFLSSSSSSSSSSSTFSSIDPPHTPSLDISSSKAPLTPGKGEEKGAVKSCSKSVVPLQLALSSTNGSGDHDDIGLLLDGIKTEIDTKGGGEGCGIRGKGSEVASPPMTPQHIRISSSTPPPLPSPSLALSLPSAEGQKKQVKVQVRDIESVLRKSLNALDLKSKEISKQLADRDIIVPA